MRIIGTLHNRRGDPLILLRLLRLLRKEGEVQSLGLAWSVPSGKVEPTWEELIEEESRVQERLRDCVRMVHDSSLSWDAKSFLGRCYRSFQYEFMVCLNLKRHDPGLRILLLDDPQVRALRYGEIGSPETFLAELASIPRKDQTAALRSSYDEYRSAYENVQVYARMILHPRSALLEISPQLWSNRTREEHILEKVEECKPGILLLRLIHCLTILPPELASSLGTTELYLANRLGLTGKVMRLSEAEKTVGPLPDRD